MISELKNRISQKNCIIDESFKGSNSQNYILVLEISTSEFYFTVFDSVSKKYIAFESYEFDSSYNYDLLADLFSVVESQSSLTSLKYKTVSCSIVNELATLVPNALYEEDRKKLYLKFNTQLQGNEFILVDNIETIDSKNIFALPLSIKIKIDNLFSRVNYHHYSSSLIHDVTSQNKNVDSAKLYINVEKNHFEILFLNKQKLNFYNSFKYTSAEDYIYYLLFVIEQLSLNPEHIELFLLGRIEKNDAIYSITYKYIKNVKFGSKTNSNDYCYQLQTLPKHSYFTIFSSFYL